jgi:hypothetical protein
MQNDSYSRARSNQLQNLGGWGSSLSCWLVEDLGVVLDRAVVGVGQRIVAEQVTQAQHHRIDVGEGAAVPDHEDVAVAELEQLALELAEQTVELARRDAQLVVAPVMRLQPREVQVHGAPVVIVPLQPPDEREQLGLDLIVLRFLHDRLERVVPEEMGEGAHVGPSDQTVAGES